MDEKLKKFDINFNILFSLLAEYDFCNLVCVDFSKINYTPGIIGVTMNEVGYIVYEIDENGFIINIFSSLNEEEICSDVLSRVGILLD